jgi:hypothetical protein
MAYAETCRPSMQGGQTVTYEHQRRSPIVGCLRLPPDDAAGGGRGSYG